MTYNLENKKEIEPFLADVDLVLLKKYLVELRIIKKNRTNLQNRALHLFYTHIATELNNLGITFNYKGITGKTLELRYTGILVKETIWRPIQITLFNIESTTEIGGKEINEIVDVIIKFFAERGISMDFPHDAFKYIEDEKNVLKYG